MTDPGEHVLVVHETYDDGFDIEHAADCPYEDEPTPDGGSVRWWRCGVEAMLQSAGLDAFFIHRDDPDTAKKVCAGRHVQALEPGRYPLATWVTRYWTDSGYEYDAGLDIGDPL
jgi:hypothetical protein